MSMAQQYLALLAPGESNFLFAAFDDDQDRNFKPVILYGTLKEHSNRLIKQNGNGYGIFILVNATEGKSRTEENVTAYRAVWIDNDSGEESNTPIKANWVVESSPGKSHEYFAVDGLDCFQRIALQAKLVEVHHSDPNAADASRVLRLPGFFHQKKNKTKGLTGERNLVRIIEENPRPRMDALDMLEAFDLPTDFSALIQTCPKASARYTQLVSSLLSARALIENPDKLSLDNQQVIDQVNRVLKLMSIGFDKNHSPISAELVGKIHHALNSINHGQLDDELQVEARNSIDKIEQAYKQICPERKLQVLNADAANDLRYLFSEGETEQIQVALFCIDPDERDTWINVGLALKNHLGPNGLELWDQWSKGSTKYNPDEIHKQWDSLNPNNIGVGTVFHLAKEHLKRRVEADAESDVLTENNRKKWQDNIIIEFNLDEHEPLKKYFLKCVTAELRVLSFGLTPATELTRQPYKANWLVKGYLEQGSLSHIFGKSGSGKSFITLSLAYCVCSGLPWFDCDVTKGGVVYLAGEGRAGLSKRLKALEQQHGLKPNNLFISDLPGRLTDEENVTEIVESIKAVCPNVKLVIVDTLHRNMGVGDENSAKDIAMILSNLSQIMAINDTSVIIVHHSGHNETNRGRGSSAITAAMDMEYSVKKTDNLITMACTKSKDHEEPAPVRLEMIEVDTGWADENGRSVTSIILEPTLVVDVSEKGKLNDKDKRVIAALEHALEKYGVPTPEEVIDYLREHDYEDHQMPDTVVHRDNWKKQVYPELDVNTDSKNPEEAKRKAFDRIRTKLRERGKIEMLGDYWWAVLH